MRYTREQHLLVLRVTWRLGNDLLLAVHLTVHLSGFPVTIRPERSEGNYYLGFYSLLWHHLKV